MLMTHCYNGYAHCLEDLVRLAPHSLSVACVHMQPACLPMHACA